jgi:hypothetical protein
MLSGQVPSSGLNVTDYRSPSLLRIDIPARCPVLGIPLTRGTGKPADSSPTIDKVVPEFGYVPGNIKVISFRANSIKRDATVDELRRVLAYTESNQPSFDRPSVQQPEAALFHQ